MNALRWAKRLRGHCAKLDADRHDAAVRSAAKPGIDRPADDAFATVVPANETMKTA